MNSFKYVCDCHPKPHILLNGLHDAVETINMEKALCQLVDSAWDDEDEEADELLACFIGNLKKDNYMHPANEFEDVVNNREVSKSNAILRNLEYDGKSCHCRQVYNMISIALNRGLVELHCRTEPNESHLLEILETLNPFTGLLRNDKDCQSFYRQLWQFSVEKGKKRLIANLVTIFPDEIDRLMEIMLGSNFCDVESVLDDSNFNRVISIVNEPNVFRHVSLYLAEQDSICPEQVQILLKAILKSLKLILPKSKYLALYSDKIRSIASLLHEAINPDDSVILNLLDSVKKEHYLDFVILVTHFSLFTHLK